MAWIAPMKVCWAVMSQNKSLQEAQPQLSWSQPDNKVRAHLHIMLIHQLLTIGSCNSA